MKKLFIFVTLFSLMMLTSCSSPETDELVEYHNSYIKTVNAKAKQVDQKIKKAMQTQSPAEAYKIHENEVQPIVQEIEQFIQSQKPKSEVVKELHEMRSKQINAWSKAIHLRMEALEVLKDSSESQQEVKDMMKQSEESLKKAMEIGKKADKKFQKLAEEYNIELTNVEEG